MTPMGIYPVRVGDGAGRRSRFGVWNGSAGWLGIQRASVLEESILRDIGKGIEGEMEKQMAMMVAVGYAHPHVQLPFASYGQHLSNGSK